MIEDKLLRDERIRLECLAQAVGSSIGVPSPPERIIEKAEKFEEYIRNGKAE